MLDLELVAELSKLDLEEGNLPDKETVTQQMNSLIIQMDLPDLPKTNRPLSETSVMRLRPDIVEPSLKRDLLLENAPQKQAGCFVVPKIV